MVNEIVFRTITGLSLRKKHAESAGNLCNLSHAEIAQAAPTKNSTRASEFLWQKHKWTQKHNYSEEKSQDLFWSASKSNQSRVPILKVLLPDNIKKKT